MRWLVALALLVTACSSAAEETPQEITWTKVELPAGDEPVLLTASGPELLVGLYHPGVRVKPRLASYKDDRFTTIPLQPKSPYAFEARWYSIVTGGPNILAIGGAPGGAHANTRWTVWTGTSKGLVEKPQSFNTFGGWGAGSLIDAIMAPPGQALVGTWGSDQAGLDAAVWLPSGDRWIRQRSTGTALQSTRDLQLTPRSAIVSGNGIVMAGSQLSLTSGVKQSAAIWRSTTLDQGWSRLDLPDSGDRGEAASVACTPEACDVTGWVDGKLAMWKVEGGDARRLTGLPEVAVGDKDVLPPPIKNGEESVQVVGEGGHVRVVRGEGDTWSVQNANGPSGALLDSALVGDWLYVIAGTSLWRARHAG